MYLWLEAAYKKVTGLPKRLCTAPVFDRNSGGDHEGHSATRDKDGQALLGRFSVVVSVIEQTDIPERRVFLYSHHVPEGLNLASIPEPVAGTRWGWLTDNTDALKSSRPEGQLPAGWTESKFQAGEKFMRYLATVAHGLVLSRSELDQLFSYHLRLAFGFKHVRGGMYSFSCYIHKDANRINRSRECVWAEQTFHPLCSSRHEDLHDQSQQACVERPWPHSWQFRDECQIIGGVSSSVTSGRWV
jgi:hypothetical protein